MKIATTTSTSCNWEAILSKRLSVCRTPSSGTEGGWTTHDKEWRYWTGPAWLWRGWLWHQERETSSLQQLISRVKTSAWRRTHSSHIDPAIARLGHELSNALRTATGFHEIYINIHTVYIFTDLNISIHIYILYIWVYLSLHILYTLLNLHTIPSNRNPWKGKTRYQISNRPSRFANSACYRYLPICDY